jgi:LysM repeat protein
MRTRTWGTLTIASILIAAVVLMILLFQERAQPAGSPTAVPVATLALVPSDEATTAPTASPAAPTATSTPAPLLYVVQPGDTLSGIAQAFGVSLQDLVAVNNIANPNLLHVGQVLIVPADIPPTHPTKPPTPAPTGGPLPTPLPTPTPSGPPLVEIGQVLGSGNLIAEVVIVRNRGGRASLEGWTLSDAEGNTFVFPVLILFEGAEVRVHSAAGVSTPTDLYWGRMTPAWNGGELIALRDATGSVVDTYIVP